MVVRWMPTMMPMAMASAAMWTTVLWMPITMPTVTESAVM